MLASQKDFLPDKGSTSILDNSIPNFRLQNELIRGEK